MPIPTKTTTATTKSEAAGEPLAIVAAGGTVPFEVATAAHQAGRRVLVLALEGDVDPRLSQFPLERVKWGQVGRLESLIADAGARQLVFIGSVDKRPDFSSIGVDFGTLKLMPFILRSMIGGDDSVLGNVVSFFEQRGIRVVGAHEVAPSLVAAPGQVAGPRISGAMMAEVRVAMEAARAIGALDIGQAAIAVGSRVVALEAAEGTDAMIERVAGLKQSGRLKWSGRAGVLAKRSKPQQDLRVDMPAVGPRTVTAVAAAGLAGIVIEAGRVLIADRAATVAEADRTGTFIFAVGEGT
ncbi:MAG TPA: UDP-2,3-diacylglucosamine diphosphatase LpxI [Bauldia sp.]|nr:UDP-2,3-diacylglucosamine diphosphatase LpxI [Bauldia sp.]